METQLLAGDGGVLTDAAGVMAAGNYLGNGNTAAWLLIGLALVCLLWGRRVSRHWD